MTPGSPWHIEKKAPLLARRHALDLGMTLETIADMHSPISAGLRERVPVRDGSHVSQRLVDLLRPAT